MNRSEIAEAERNARLTESHLAHSENYDLDPDCPMCQALIQGAWDADADIEWHLAHPEPDHFSEPDCPVCIEARRELRRSHRPLA